MTRRSRISDPETLRHKLVSLLTDFESHLQKSDLRTQVLELVPANHLLRDLGSSLIETELTSARNRILAYLKKYVGEIVRGDELMVVAGISEYARRVRELRVQFGWRIISGVTAAESVAQEGTPEESGDALAKMKTDEYMLVSLNQDREASYRWNVANDLRKQKEMGARDKILKFLQLNVGNPVGGEELRYVANGATEWARRVRELRTEYGWPVATHYTGRPDLPPGWYVLERNVQAPPHDRKIKDDVRRTVLMRDGYKCNECGWTRDSWQPEDARHLEVHHVIAHADKGSNKADNLVTLCNICHDIKHRE